MQTTNPVPGEIFAAIMTGRTEFLTMLKTSIHDNSRTVTQGEALGLIDLIIELVDKMAAMRKSREEAERCLALLRGQLKGVVTKSNEALDAVQAHLREYPVSEDVEAEVANSKSYMELHHEFYERRIRNQHKKPLDETERME